MLTLNEITLKRFRIHEDLTLRFNEGVTGIIGRNGSGKSSILEAINFLFTGNTDDPKAQVVTAGATGSSYVRGEFTLHGQNGTIERALDSSRVRLEYGDQKLVNVKEVKQLWDELLQIDGHIFQNVIMAKQKKIPELFSGDNSVREKAFQRIFKVPNTESVRAIIWDYIKSAPPLVDVSELGTLVDSIAESQLLLTDSINRREDLAAKRTSDQVKQARTTYLSHLQSCIWDASRRPALEQKAQELRIDIDRAETVQEEVVEKLDALAGMSVVEEILALRTQKAQYAEYLRCQHELAQAEGALGPDSVVSSELLKMSVADLNRLSIEVGNNIIAANLQQESARAEEQKIKKNIGPSVCPTCRRPLDDNDTEHKEQMLEQLRLKQADCGVQIKLLQEEQKVVKVARLTVERQQYPSSFDESRLTALETVEKGKAELQTSKKNIEATLVQLNNELNRVTTQIEGLTVYKGASTPEEELAAIERDIEASNQVERDYNSATTAVAVAEQKVKMLQDRQAALTRAVVNNEKIGKYTETLREVYDILHSTQFARRLLQTYSATVEQELRIQLQRFELPYDVAVDENFKINVSKAGDEIPRLSGGQEMVVGFCLRLALHSIFSQAFPMLIIDEGTTHLDTTNQKLYFQCIEDLKTDKTIRQLIIVDHSEMLSGVVDHVIQI